MVFIGGWENMAYKVMAADDEAIMRKAMSALINWEELECELVFVASNGTEVMEHLKVLKPDILILDIQMPGMSGIEIARYIWEEKLGTKVILLTAYADFSYAQSAIKYDVVDYVIKSGAMDGIITAIEKAKGEIKKAAVRQSVESVMARRENFFRSVFEGSLHNKDEILETAGKLGIDMSSGFLVVLIHFRMEGELESERQQRTYHSLLNFLKMVFGESMSLGFAVKKYTLAVVLTGLQADFRREMQEKVDQIIDMMENFMKLKVSIGTGEINTNILELQSEYDKAERAMEERFFNTGSGIMFFSERRQTDKTCLEALEKCQKELYYLIKKGSKEEAVRLFHTILELQERSGEPVNMILSSGVNIRNQCRKLLLEYDKNIYDITPYESSISALIYGCMHVSEYSEIMETVISCTAEYIGAAASKKDTLIHECEKYIEENFEKSITVSDISRSIGTSPSYLSRIFKEATGNTIIHSINQRKINKAKEYLSTTDMKIYEIADALGFENTTYFSHFFKKHMGMSPKEFKELSVE